MTVVATFKTNRQNPQVTGIQLQGGSPQLQGSSPRLQGSSPRLQGSSPQLQVTNNPYNYRIVSSGGGGSTQQQTPAPSNPNGGGGGGSAPARPDRSNSIAMQLAGIEATKRMEQAGLSAVDKALANLFREYAIEAAANEKNYNQQTTTNTQNLQTNKQVAMLHAAQGRRGLFGTLQSIGALSGDGITLANRAVQQGANADIAGAQGTFNENQTNLDTAINAFREEDKRRQRINKDQAAEAKVGVRNQAAIARQKYLAQLADDYAQMGDEAKSKHYAREAAALYAKIADTGIPSTKLAPIQASFTPSTLANYIAGGDTSVTVVPASPGGVPGLVAGPTPVRRRREE